jgi:hypothetical protein
MHARTSILIAALLALVLTAGVVLAQNGGQALRPEQANGDPLVPDYQVMWSVQAAGGAGSPMAGGGWSASATLGQVAAGRAGGPSRRACAGFWCAWQPYKVYLPVVLRNG